MPCCFEKTLQLLKGLPELGVLLQVERELPKLIREVYGGGKDEDLFTAQDKGIWEKAEIRLREALTDFATAAKSTYQGRLFAQDALQGLRLIDLCGEVFDVVVMNPPFGLSSKELFEQLKESYPDGYVDLYACFICRAVELCSGWVGAISSRSFLITKKLERLRTIWVTPRLECLLDLGWPVMDDATVQSAAFTLNCTKSGPSDDITAIDRKPYSNKSDFLISQTIDRIDTPDCFEVKRELMSRIPKAKILYNLDPAALQLFLKSIRIGDEIILAKQGMKTFSDFRFLRARHEVNPTSIGKGLTWVPLAKGGAYAVFYSDLPLIVNWGNGGAQICEVNRLVNGQTAQARQASVHYYKRGGTYSRRCKEFGVRVLPDNFIIGEKGPAILPQGDFSPISVVGLMNARLFKVIINLQANAKQYDTGIVESCPYIPLSRESLKLLENLTNQSISALRCKSQRAEGDALFVCPEIASSFAEMESLEKVRFKEVQTILDDSIQQINALVDDAYRIDSSAIERIVLDQTSEDDDASTPHNEDDEADNDERSQGKIEQSKALASNLLSYTFGCAIGRWDIRYANGNRSIPVLGDAFEELPRYFPGALLVGEPNIPADNYLLSLPLEGIVVDDEGHRFDIIELLRPVFSVIWKENAEQIEHDITNVLGDDSLRYYIRKPARFFANHLAMYTRSKRRAPIYWPLSTASGSYTLWLYYPMLTNQTLYTAINDFMDGPDGKLKQTSDEITSLRNKGSARTSEDEKQFESLQAFELELIELRDTLLKLAPNYKPNLDDGVQISAAPLWPLFRHKPWQKVLKETWDKLEKGDYDWAHLAMNYWPERVRLKCKTDKSLAIAHGLEELYIEPELKQKKVSKKRI